ncbi:MAG: peptidylprolyl isomerase [Spirochaetes bacterium]|nr:peptidylprolyl isomerase [Spirochaetota bacterium]
MKKVLTIVILLSIFSSMNIIAMDKPGLYIEFKTNAGDFVCELYYKEVPLMAANIVGLAEGTRQFTDPATGKKVKRPFYNGLIFHRVIDGFMIQGGDPLGDGRGGPGYRLVDQISRTLKHNSEGILSMANAGPNTNGSQFFITLAPTPHLDGKHAVFGKVIKGMEIVRKIGKVKTNQANRPLDNIIMKEVNIIRTGDDAKAFDAEKEFARKDEVEINQQAALLKKKDFFLKQLGVNTSKIQTTKSGLQYYVIRSGSGVQPRRGQTIIAHYAGYLTNGQKFDSSYDRNQPFATVIGAGRVIPGWDEAFLAMRKGEKRILIIPYHLAYGEQGYPGVIPPKATLIFDVELLDLR